MASVRYGILGPLEVDDGRRLVDLGSPKQRAVLALLLINRNRVVSLDRLIDQLWNGEPPQRAIASLQAYLSNLRRLLEPTRLPRAAATTIVTSPPGYVLRADAEQVDAARFEELVRRGRQMLGENRPRECLELLTSALDLWRGPALADFAYEPFARSEIVRLEELHLAAMEDRFAATLDLGGEVDVVPELEVVVREHPFRERFWAQLMLALYRSGRQSDALRAFQRARDVLVDELGVEPGQILRAMEADILAHAPTLDAGAGVTATRAHLGGDADVTDAEPVSSESVFLGRRSELARLMAAVDRTRTGSGRLVLVSGEAGIGKTRLVNELVGSLGPDVIVARGSGYEGGLAPGFWSWVQVLRAVCEQGDDGLVRSSLAPHASVLHQLIPEIVGGASDIDERPTRDASRFQLYDAVTGFLLQVARDQPMVVVLDDLHWVDPASLELLGFFAERLSSAALLFIGTYRPNEVSEALADALANLARAGVHERLELSGLALADVEELIRRTTRAGAGSGVAAAVHGRTEGNPFFVGEVVRLLVSENLLAEPPDRAVRIPEGVRDVIRRRMARLPEQTAVLLTLAAVIGLEFDLGLVEEAAGLEPDLAFDVVESAVVSGLIIEDPSAPGRFRFSHGLVQEAVYEEVTALRRSRLHARIAHALERHGAANDTKGIADLAHHYFQAARAGDAASAVEWAMRAAEAALQGLGYEAAEAQLERAQAALAMLAHDQTRDRMELDLQLRLMRVLSLTKGYASEGMERACARAHLLARQLGDASQLAQLLWSEWGVHIGHADFDAADRTGQQLLDLGHDNDDELALLGGLQSRGSGAVHRGRLAEGRALLQQGLELADRLEDPALAERFFQHPAVFARSFLALAEWLAGCNERANELSGEAASIAEKLDHPFTTTLALFFDSWLAAFQRDDTRARIRGDAARALASAHGFALFAPMATIVAAWARGQQGEPIEAAVDIRAALDALASTGTRMVGHFFLALQAETERAAGQPHVALSTVERALQEVDELGERFYAAELHRLRGELVIIVRQAPQEGIASLQLAAKIAGEQGAVPLQARAHASLQALAGKGLA
ncbi:MAG: hypothetical protein QOI95_2249 [Acidimicrobiaceae bacterium]|jgi:DNA-binding SARP family transcriptional activator